MKIAGKACIVSQPEEVNGLVSLPEEIREKALHQLVLVKVKMQSAEYYENVPERSSSWLQGLQTQFTKWLKPHPTYRPYKLAS